MSTDDRVVLRFYLALSWDFPTFVNYVYAPANWADMTEDERQEFLSAEAHQFMENNVEYGATVYDPATDRRDHWETGGDPGEPDEVFD